MVSNGWPTVSFAAPENIPAMNPLYFLCCKGDDLDITTGSANSAPKSGGFISIFRGVGPEEKMSANNAQEIIKIREDDGTRIDIQPLL